MYDRLEDKIKVVDGQLCQVISSVSTHATSMETIKTTLDVQMKKVSTKIKNLRVKWLRPRSRLQIVKSQSNKKCKDYLTRLRVSKVCWGRYQFSNNIWKEMTTELRRLKVKYWFRRNWTVGQLQIARATADHGHTGQSEIERSYVSEKSNYCLGRLSQQRRSLLISTSFIVAEPFLIFYSRHSATAQ